MSIDPQITDIAKYSTFGIHQNVMLFSIKSISDLNEYFTKYGKDNYFVLGGGSNIIPTDDIKNKNVLKIEIKGINILNEDNDNVYIEASAGEVWDEFVAYCINNNYSGIECLSAIPGSVGASPVQNVGAYGAEIKDVLVSCNAYEIHTGNIAEFTNSECNFSYRNSIFKSEFKNKYIITSIKFKLSKSAPKMPSYEPVQKYFIESHITNPTLEEIRNAIIKIRWSKLPHPEVLGNCGSFFENPIVQKSHYDKLKLKYPEIPGFSISHRSDLGENTEENMEEMIKIPAGYLIEKAGLKGMSFGKVGTYEKNSLVLVNHGNASYNDVLNAKQRIIELIKDEFDIVLKSEPEFV